MIKVIFCSWTASFIFISWLGTQGFGVLFIVLPPKTPTFKTRTSVEPWSRTLRVLELQMMQRRGEWWDWERKEATRWKPPSLDKNLLKYFAAIIKMKMLSRKLAKCPNRALLAVIPASQALTRKLYNALESFGDLTKMQISSPTLRESDSVWVYSESRNLYG